MTAQFDPTPPARAEDRPPTLSVVVPVYNERATIEEILSRVQAVDIEKEIIVVDDASSDGTREYLVEMANRVGSNSPANTNLDSQRLPRRDNIRVFFQEKNCGKGAALRRGFEEARGEIVIIQDADLELDPQDYYRLIDPIVRGLSDVVYGSRFLGKTRQGIPFAPYAANKILTLASNLATGLHLTDAWTGYKVFRREVLQKIALREDRFGFEPEITAKVASRGHQVFEVPVSYTCRTRAEGKKIRWKDGLRGLWCTWRYARAGELRRQGTP
jgi:glycosyltransferase involved in cell wall biosynthesis